MSDNAYPETERERPSNIQSPEHIQSLRQHLAGQPTRCFEDFCSSKTTHVPGR